MISPDILTIPAAGQDLYGKTAGDMGTDLRVDVAGNVTGTFEYVTGYTGFNASKAAEQEGYYFPFCLTQPGETMTFIKNGKPGKTSIPWEANNVFRVTQKDTFEVKVDDQTVVTFNFKNATFKPKG